MAKWILVLSLVGALGAGSGCAVGGFAGPLGAGVYGDGAGAAERIVVTRDAPEREEEDGGASWPEITILGTVIGSGVVVGLLAGVL